MSDKIFSKNLPIKNRVSQWAYATYFLIILLFLALRTTTWFLNYYKKLPNTVWFDVLSTILIQIILMFTISLFVFSGFSKHKPKQVARFFGYKKIPTKAIVIAFVLGVIVFFLNSYVASFFQEILTFLGFRSSRAPMTEYPWWLFLLNIVFTAVLPAICEETAHRGLALKGAIGFGATKAIIISGLLFGLMHMNIEQFFYASLIGFYLGFLALHTDSIWPGVIIHFTNNALATFFGFASFHNWAISDFVNSVTTINSSNMFVGIIFNAAFVTLLVIGLAYFSKAIIQNTSEGRVRDLQKHIYSSLVKQEYMENIDRSKQALSGTLDEKPTEAFVDVEQMFFDKNIDLGYMSNLEKEIIEDGRKYKPDKFTILAMTMSFIVGIGATIFTLVWGIIC